MTNRKPDHRKGKIQLIDASEWFTPLRKNLGKKNCELSAANIKLILDTFLKFEETEKSRIFQNAEFGYQKIRIERPLRLRSQLSNEAVGNLRFASGDVALRMELLAEFGPSLVDDFDAIKSRLEDHLAPPAEEDDEESEEQSPPSVPAAARKRVMNPKTWRRDAHLHGLGLRLRDALGDSVFADHNAFSGLVNKQLSAWDVKLSAADRKALLRGVSWRDKAAPPVIKKIHKSGAADPVNGLFTVEVEDRQVIVEYEPDSDLTDYEEVSLLDPDGVLGFVKREVLPWTPDAWIDSRFGSKLGYEMSFTKYFYEPEPLRSLEEISQDIVRLEAETEGLIGRIVGDLATGGSDE